MLATNLSFTLKVLLSEVMIVLDYSSEEFKWLKVQYFFIKFKFMPYLFLVQHVLFAIKV